MAKHLQVSQAAVSRRLLGVVPFDVVELEAAADLLQVPISALLNDAPESSVPAVSA